VFHASLDRGWKAAPTTKRETTILDSTAKGKKWLKIAAQRETTL
jgi:DNA-binding NarL/FixJ family response regulator